MTRPEAVETARRMHDGGAGWPIDQIRLYLAARGHDAAWSTVKGWADPDWWERRQAAQRRRWHAKKHQDAVAPDLLLALRLEDRLSYAAIAAVTRRFLGEQMTEEQVRYRLHELGVPKNPNKARAATAVAA